MGDAKKRQDAERVRASQNWNLRVTFGERFELRACLLQRHVKDDAVMDRNSEAIEAIEGEDAFSPPAGLDGAGKQEWFGALQDRINEGTRGWLPLTIENVATILDAIEWCAANGVVTTQAGEKVVLMDGARAFRLRHAKKRLKGAKLDTPIPGEAEPARVEMPAADPAVEPS